MPGIFLILDKFERFWNLELKEFTRKLARKVDFWECELMGLI